MATNYLTQNIRTIVNDSVKDALGKTATGSITSVETTSFVSCGKAIDDFDAYDGFFGALANRIAKTVYAVRSYEGRARTILRDEHEYGAFIQKVYYTMPDAVDNPSYASPTWSDSTPSYSQQSPYDVEATLTISSLCYGGKGTWSIEIIRPIVQIKEAFLSESAMAAFIDGIYLTIENAFKLEEERVIATAGNTAMAMALNGGHSRNLLSEYNTAHSTATLTVDQAMESPEFIRYATKEIKMAIDNMGVMSTAFNRGAYNTFTPKDKMVVEMLTHFAAASETYLQADTFHDDLVKLPNFEKIPFWQTSGPAFAFTDCSKINVEHDDLDVGSSHSNVLEQGGIICFVHDIENVAAYFGERRSWEMVNPRSEVVIHGEKAVKGFAVDNNANAVVFYIAV